MFPFLTQVVLLFAVSISQFFGGISCCCLGRELFGSANAAKAASSQECESKKESVSQAKPIGKCPKCTRQEQSKPGGDLAKRSLCHAGLSGDDQCRCVKMELRANIEVESTSIPIEEKALAGSASAPILSLAAGVLCVCKFEVPLRCGGRSWQVIACVWKV